MLNKNIIGELFQIYNLDVADLDDYFKELGYYSYHHASDDFIYKCSDLKDIRIYQIMTMDNVITFCRYAIQEKMDVEFLIKQASEDYGSINVPIEEAQSFILDTETMRLSI